LLSVFTAISENSRHIAVFLALIDYFYSKQDTSKCAAIREISHLLKVPYESIMKNIYGHEVALNEEAEALWLLHDKSLVLIDESEQFTSSIEKKDPKCHIIRNVKDLEDFTFF
jgi:hypothetical protein